MISFPNPFGNWFSSLNDAVREIISIFTESNQRILARIDRLEGLIMASLDALKAAVAANEAKLQEVGETLVAEAQEIKNTIDELKSKVNFDVAGLADEVAKIEASTAKLGELGAGIANLVVTEVVPPVDPIEPPVE